MVRLGFFSHSVQDVVTKKYHNFQETSRSPQNFNFFKKISITDRPIFKLDILPKSVRQRQGRGLLNTPEWKRRLADWKQNGWTAQSTRVDPNPTVQGTTEIIALEGLRKILERINQRAFILRIIQHNLLGNNQREQKINFTINS